MNLVTVFQIMALISGSGLIITLIIQWKELTKMFKSSK